MLGKVFSGSLDSYLSYKENQTPCGPRAVRSTLGPSRLQCVKPAPLPCSKHPSTGLRRDYPVHLPPSVIPFSFLRYLSCVCCQLCQRLSIARYSCLGTLRLAMWLRYGSIGKRQV
jgi:hypothetical protein